MIKFSIIIPVYNAEKVIERSIKSVINQSYSNWELILVDDGSTDKTFDLIKKYETADNRIKVYHQENSGPGKARNYGINVCNGDYILFIDSDDYIETDYLTLVDKEINKNNFDLIFISMINEKENGKIKNTISTTNYCYYKKDDLLKLEIMGLVPWGPCSKIVKKTIVKNCLFSDLAVGEEIIYSFNVINKAEKIGFIEKGLYHYVHNDNGQHKKGGDDPWWPVVDNMKSYLISQNKVKEYEMALNGLALRALSISIFRISNTLKYKEARKSIKQQIDKYGKKYNLNKVEKKYLDFSSKIILKLINLKLYFIIYMSSKIKNKFR